MSETIKMRIADDFRIRSKIQPSTPLNIATPKTNLSHTGVFSYNSLCASGNAERASEDMVIFMAKDIIPVKFHNRAIALMIQKEVAGLV